MVGQDYVAQMWDNALVTVQSGNIVQEKRQDRDWRRKEDVQGNSEKILLIITAVSMHENQIIAKLFQASYSKRDWKSTAIAVFIFIENSFKKTWYTKGESVNVFAGKFNK